MPINGCALPVVAAVQLLLGLASVCHFDERYCAGKQREEESRERV